MMKIEPKRSKGLFKYEYLGAHSPNSSLVIENLSLLRDLVNIFANHLLMLTNSSSMSPFCI